MAAAAASDTTAQQIPDVYARLPTLSVEQEELLKDAFKYFKMVTAKEESESFVNDWPPPEIHASLRG